MAALLSACVPARAGVRLLASGENDLLVHYGIGETHRREDAGTRPLWRNCFARVDKREELN